MLSINRNIFFIYTLLEGPHFLSGPGLLLALHGPGWRTSFLNVINAPPYAETHFVCLSFINGWNKSNCLYQSLL